MLDPKGGRKKLLEIIGNTLDDVLTRGQLHNKENSIIRSLNLDRAMKKLGILIPCNLPIVPRFLKLVYLLPRQILHIFFF